MVTNKTIHVLSKIGKIWSMYSNIRHLSVAERQWYYGFFVRRRLCHLQEFYFEPEVHIWLIKSFL